MLIFYLFQEMLGVLHLQFCRPCTYRIAARGVQGVQLHTALGHPWAGEDLSLKIDERDQTIQICILELQLFHSSQMKLKLAGLFFQKSTRWHQVQSKIYQQKNRQHFYSKNFMRPSTFLLCKKIFVSEKTQKNELCHFSKEIYVIKFFALQTRT